MKKLIFTSIIFAGLLWSCNTSSDDEIVVNITALKTIEYKYAGGPTIKWEYFHSDIDSVKYTTDYQFKSLNIVLREQKITGDINIRSVTYNYDNNFMTVQTYGPQTTTVKYKLSTTNGQVTHTVNGGVETPYPIVYNSDIRRTKYGETLFDISSLNYVKAYVTDGLQEQVIARYEYSLIHLNAFGIQQKGIVGVPYIWASARFGYQSRNLLSKAEVMEDGAIAVYTFEYTPDASGLLKEEIIKRNGSLYCTNTYTYVQGKATFK